jgi:hypothetical protein
MADKVIPTQADQRPVKRLTDQCPQLSPEAAERGEELLAEMERYDARELRDVVPVPSATRKGRTAA